MKLSYRNGFLISDRATGIQLEGLTSSDAFALFQGTRLEYDRLRSFKKPSSRLWADGVSW